MELETITFVTTNKEKITDISKMLGEKYRLKFNKDIDLTEIQTLSVEEVVEHKAKQAFKLLKTPVVVSDSGLEIEALNKFPGALVKYANETIGQEGIIKLLDDKKNRFASFVAAIAYCATADKVHIFVEKDIGEIATEPRGDGWHFDKIFIPEGETKTWAEIGRLNKNKESAFRRALEKLAQFLNTE